MNQDVSIPPQPLVGLARLMRMAHAGEDISMLGEQFVSRARADMYDAHALLDLSTVMQLRGDRDLAMSIQAQALEVQQLYVPPTAAAPGALRVLAMMAPGDLMSNTPLEFLLERENVELQLLYLAPHLPLPPELPDHDVLFVAIGESDENLSLLGELEAVLAEWPRPVLNRPGQIAQLTRDNVCALLKGAPGVAMPETARVERQALRQTGYGELAVSALLAEGQFPLIVRPVDSHAGKGLDKLDAPADIATYLQDKPQTEFYISRFVDYRNADGQFRKYRIVLIGGRPYLCHLAISSNWMIHYLNAGMTESAEKRAEEARCMENFDEDFARRHADAFRAIHERMGLDYLGIDCGETADGKLLVFEVDSNMIVHAIDPVDVYPYKQPQMRKIFEAFCAMLRKAAGRGAA